MPALNRRNVWSFLQRVDTRVPEAHLDLSQTDFIHPFAVAALGLFLRYWNRQGLSFGVKAPEEEAVGNYLTRVRFCQRFNVDARSTGPEKLHRIDVATSLNDIIDIADLVREPDVGYAVTDRLGEMLARLSHRIPAKELAELAGELADNFSVHSGEDLAVLTAQYFPKLRCVSLVVGDCGCGFRTSLARNPVFGFVEHFSHCDAVSLALGPLVSSRAEGGMGLSDVVDTVRGFGGTLYVSSGDGEVFVKGTTELARTRDFDFPGVQFQVDVPEACP